MRRAQSIIAQIGLTPNAADSPHHRITFHDFWVTVLRHWELRVKSSLCWPRVIAAELLGAFVVTCPLTQTTIPGDLQSREAPRVSLRRAPLAVKEPDNAAARVALHLHFGPQLADHE